SLSAKYHPAAIRRKARIQIFRSIAYCVGSRARFTTLRRKQPKLAQQVEYNRSIVRRDVEAKSSTLLHANGNCLQSPMRLSRRRTDRDQERTHENEPQLTEHGDMLLSILPGLQVGVRLRATNLTKLSPCDLRSFYIT